MPRHRGNPYPANITLRFPKISTIHTTTLSNTTASAISRASIPASKGSLRCHKAGLKTSYYLLPKQEEDIPQDSYLGQCCKAGLKRDWYSSRSKPQQDKTRNTYLRLGLDLD